jgi:hypothetical protein
VDVGLLPLDPEEPIPLRVDFPRPNGRRTSTVRARDAAGRTREASFARLWHVGDVPSALTELPGLGGDADALALNAPGDAAGWAADADGVRGAVLWRAGVPVPLDVPDATRADVVMSRRGRILVGRSGADSALHVWRWTGRRTSRVRLADPAWRVDAVRDVNAEGQIVAHAVHAGTGRRAAVLLAPSR